ncbi:hypothetical protein HBB16_09665 [Pseudonocardia sp. MCCB 268]|nr:hypothetical protein [Pseudonocardia cytotoxica]
MCEPAKQIIHINRIIICVNGRLSRLGRPHSERQRRDTSSGTHPDAVARSSLATRGETGRRPARPPPARR